MQSTPAQHSNVSKRQRGTCVQHSAHARGSVHEERPHQKPKADCNKQRNSAALAGGHVEDALDGGGQRLVARLVHLPRRVCCQVGREGTHGGQGGDERRGQVESGEVRGQASGLAMEPSRRPAAPAGGSARAGAQAQPLASTAAQRGEHSAPEELGCEIWCWPMMRLPSASSAPSVMWSSAQHSTARAAGRREARFVAELAAIACDGPASCRHSRCPAEPARPRCPPHRRRWRGAPGSPLGCGPRGRRERWRPQATCSKNKFEGLHWGRPVQRMCAGAICGSSPAERRVLSRQTPQSRLLLF